jgi:hypothetical protein
MKKEFIPYEQALELKELGFDEDCLGWYQDNTLRLDINSNQSIKFHEHLGRFKGCFLAPLYQQTFRWFREKYGLYAEIFVDDNKTFGFYITSFIEEGRLDKPITRQFNTYDEAELGCVKQLIEIIDRKDEAYQ